MIVHFRRYAAVTFTALAVSLAGGCGEKPVPSVMQPSMQPPGPETTDVDVTNGVKSALLNDGVLKSFDIAVVTTKGDVLLTGQVDNQSQINGALELVRSVKGVHSVHDELALKK